MCICAAPTTPFEGVTVYGRRQATDYQEVRRFFEGRGVVFDHADIEGDQASLQRMVELSGQQEAVVIEIGKNIFVGLNPAELDRVLP
ncbi:MAG: glutaredoxin family protein [Anaerolineales bacterium]|nr:glutaredoxin family protein [Anaerolineales bacterium]